MLIYHSVRRYCDSTHRVRDGAATQRRVELLSSFLGARWKSDRQKTFSVRRISWSDAGQRAQVFSEPVCTEGRRLELKESPSRRNERCERCQVSTDVEIKLSRGELDAIARRQ